MDTLLFLCKQEIFFIGILTAVIYWCLTAYLLNVRLVTEVFSSPTAFWYKWTILVGLGEGFFTSLPIQDILLTVIIGFLVGLNIDFAIRTFQQLKKNGKIHLSFGTAAVIGLVTTGCGACGFSLLSIAGISVGFIAPFANTIIKVIIIGVLLWSSIVLYQENKKASFCEAKKKG